VSNVIPVDFKAARARRIALARAEYLNGLAEELAAVADTPEGRVYMAGYYEAKEWANAADLAIALMMLAERTEPVATEQELFL